MWEWAAQFGAGVAIPRALVDWVVFGHTLDLVGSEVFSNLPDSQPSMPTAMLWFSNSS